MSNKDNYANRVNEYEAVINALQSGAKVVILNAYQASGITSFIQERLKYASNRTHMFYCNAATSSSLAEMLFRELLRSQYRDKLQLYANKHLGSRSDTVLAAAIKAVPYAGELLSWALSPKGASPIYTGDYASAIEELLPFFFREISAEKKIIVSIDAAQEMSEDSYEPLRSLISNHSCQFLLAITEQNVRTTKLLNSIRRLEYKIEEIQFDRPHIKLIKEIGELYGHQLNTDEASDIVERTQHNIHEIIDCIYSMNQLTTISSLSSWEKAIISVLYIFGMPLTIDVLVSIISSCEIFAPDPNKEICAAVTALLERGIISQEREEYSLKVHHHPLVKNVLNSYADMLIYMRESYEYLCNTKTCKNSKLRYELSKKLSCTTNADAKIYMKEIIISGKAVPQEVYNDAQLVNSDYSDCLLASIALCRERRFHDALKWINAIPDSMVNDEVKCFKATLQNRTRQTELAEQTLKRCLERNISSSQKNILAAYLVTNYIHSEKLSKAREVYLKYDGLYSDYPYHGYLVRNAASAYSENRIELYDRAMLCFRNTNDNFGYYTTLSNKGYALCLEGNYQESLKVLQEAANGLEPFSGVNLHIVYNNLGICNMMLGNYNQSHRFFTLAESLGKNSMPRIFASVNIACLEAINGQYERALIRLKKLDNQVENHPIDRVRQKYYPNRLLVEYLNGNRNIKDLINVATKYPDRYNLDLSKKRLNIYRRFLTDKKAPRIDRWKELYSPCGLAYWYIDPLKLFRESFVN